MSFRETESTETKLQRLTSFRETWKNKPNSYGDLKATPIFNSWRNLRNKSLKLKSGCCDSWKEFKNFYSDMSSTYQKNYVLIKLNPKEPYSKENCSWVTHEEKFLFNKRSNVLEYLGQSRTLKEWALEYKIPVEAIRQRFTNSKKLNYTSEEIIFGIFNLDRKKGDEQVFKTKNETRKIYMKLNSYKLRDKKKGLEYNLTFDWFMKNIHNQKCYYCGTVKNLGIDRIDNKIGHTIDNSIPCCVECNNIRGNKFSIEEMLLIGPFVRNIINKRNS